MSEKTKKQFILHLPYVILGLFATNLGGSVETDGWYRYFGEDNVIDFFLLTGIFQSAAKFSSV